MGELAYSISPELATPEMKVYTSIHAAMLGTAVEARSVTIAQRIIWGLTSRSKSLREAAHCWPVEEMR